MKKSHMQLVIILTVLITVILIASIALVIALSVDSAPGTTSGSTTPVVDVTTDPIKGTTASTTTTTVKPADPTTPATTTKPNTPDTTTTKKPVDPPAPNTTTKPADPPKSDTTTKPADTTKPNTPAPTPGLNAVSGTVKGDSIDSLGIFAEYVTEEIDKDTNTIKIRFTFYLQSYGLRIGARGDNYLIVNGETFKKLSTAKIDLPNGSPLTRTELYEYVVEIQKTDANTPVELALEYHWHFQGTYAGERADWLTVTVDLTV